MDPKKVQRFVYSRVQCRPSTTGECVNVGVILGRGENKSFQYHDFARPAMLFLMIGVDPLTVHAFVRNVVEPRARGLSTEQDLAQWSMDRRSLLEVQHPMPILAKDAEQALQIVRRMLVPKQPKDSASEVRDWPEDAADTDNGSYMCTCSVCGASFIGHKRRVQCKLCASKTSLHQWLAGNLVIPHEHCGNCLAIRRKDGQNSAHCRGPIGMRQP